MPLKIPNCTPGACFWWVDAAAALGGV